MDLERTFHNIIYVMMTSLLFRIARGRPFEFNGDHVTFRPINFANDNDVINFRNVVDSLEQLGILAPGNCYALDLAERTVEKGKRPKTGEGVATSIIVSLSLRLSADLPTNERADFSVTTPSNAAGSSAIVACSRTMTPPTTDVMTTPTDVSQSEASRAVDRKRSQLLSINMRQASINSSRSITSPSLNVTLEVDQMEASRNTTRRGTLQLIHCTYYRSMSVIGKISLH